eukprot:jgi/Botrbrau1/6111/Bobra.331_2s0006.1
MPTPALYGALFGFSVQVYSNVIRKYPVFYQPWQHVFFAGVGAWAGEALVDWTERSSKEVDEILKQRAEANKNL